MDDVEDDSELRRGVPVAHKVYGVPQTINTANYVYFLAFQELLSLKEGTSGKNLTNVDVTAMVNGELTDRIARLTLQRNCSTSTAVRAWNCSTATA